MDDKFLKDQLAVDLKKEFNGALSSRINRYMEVKPHEITPATHFAPVSAECTLLFRDGYFYGSIALCQAVAESLARFICERNGWKPSNNFEENVSKLCTRGFISSEVKSCFQEIWKDRDDYHHLNPSIENDRTRLELFSKGKIILLVRIEKDIFSFSLNEGKIVPKHPKYWAKNDGDTYVEAFLKIRP